MFCRNFLLLGSMVCLLANCAAPTITPKEFISKTHLNNRCTHEYPKKNVTKISFYEEKHIFNLPYRVIGSASVNKYDLFGRARSQDKMQALMKNLAASIGGDGLIHVKNNDDQMVAEIIAFEKILI